MSSVSAIRLFVLSSFEKFGPMHGHRLRLLAELEHVDLWTDISVGAVYGAMKRLATEGLLRASSQEQEGNRPIRHLYEITEEGRHALASLRSAGLSEVWFRYDPFDLALTRPDPEFVDTIPSVLAERLDKIKAMLAETKQINEEARPYITLSEEWAVLHTEYRLEAEIVYLTDLLKAANDIVADQHNPRPSKVLTRRTRPIAK